jgi:hypothetical protein
VEETPLQMVELYAHRFSRTLSYPIVASTRCTRNNIIDIIYCDKDRFGPIAVQMVLQQPTAALAEA